MTQITLVGLGNMGVALVEALLKAGKTVTIWNRTPTKPAISSLVSAGAKFEPSLASAIAASPLMVVCVLNYENIHQIFDSLWAKSKDVPDTVVNVTNGTPRDAREMSSWMHNHGVKTYIDGGIMTTPSLIGTPASFVLCSGENEESFNNIKSIIEIFGRANYLGEDPGAAPLYDLALLAGMYGMFAGAMTAMGLIQKQKPNAGQSVALIEPAVTNMLNPMLSALLPSHTKIAGCLDNGDYAAYGNPLEMQAIAMENVRKTCDEEGADIGPLRYFFDMTESVRQAGGSEGGIALVAKKMLGR